jgi:hypothetical protein
MHEELENFERNHIWTLVEPPRDVNVIETKCVFKNKQGEDGEVVRNKARLVAQGFSQVEGLDFGEIGFLLVVLVHVDSHTRSSHLPRCLHVAWSDRVDPHMKFPDFIFPQLVSVFTFTGGFFLRNRFLIGHNIFVLLDFFPSRISLSVAVFYSSGVFWSRTTSNLRSSVVASLGGMFLSKRRLC